ncbi:flagellar hook protein FlgE [Microbacterium foliorum]|uniref:Flagellar hook protein FlgE n=1 Tax=Microbacterium foliorum TaxID=104336 RepID=A0ABU1HRM4_9MICO|nr:flagellar hook protein FlgE [Microbacterium foliorum]
MLRSLYSGISGLRSHQTMLDVTGNNIANVNTAGFKGSSVLFQDSLSQLIGNPGIPDDEVGGRNPAQVGLAACRSPACAPTSHRARPRRPAEEAT